MKDLDKVYEDECPSCKAEMMLPLFESAELERVCNLCGWTPETDSPIEGEEE